MDVSKIGPGCYQYRAVDKMVKLFERRAAVNTQSFLDKTVDEMPFAIQRIQTDRGREFFADNVQELLLAWAIRFRPHRLGRVLVVDRTRIA
jgi:hypothetical protein